MNAINNKLTDEGIRKAAILVACLDRAAADAILEQLGDEQSHRVLQAVVQLDEIPEDEKTQVFDEFFHRKPRQIAAEPMGIDLESPAAREIFSRRLSLSNKPEANAPTGKPFVRLCEAESEKLAKLLSSERPQTIALVLSHLPTQQAGAVLSYLTSEIQVDVIKRLVELEETDPIILYEVEQALEARMSQQIRMQRRRVAGIEALNGILDASTGEVRKQILGNLVLRDRLLAARVMPPPMAFEDLADLDDRLLVEVLRESEEQWLMPALLGAAPTFVERVLNLLPRANAQLLRRRLHQPGPIRLSDVDAARRRISEIATRIVFAKKKSFLGAA